MPLSRTILPNDGGGGQHAVPDDGRRYSLRAASTGFQYRARPANDERFRYGCDGGDPDARLAITWISQAASNLPWLRTRGASSMTSFASTFRRLSERWLPPWVRPPETPTINLYRGGFPDQAPPSQFVEIARARFADQVSQIDAIDTKANRTLTFAGAVAVAPIAFVAGRSVPEAAVALFVIGFVLFVLAAVLSLIVTHPRDWSLGPDEPPMWNVARRYRDATPAWWVASQYGKAVSENKPLVEWKANRLQIATQILAGETFVVGLALVVSVAS